ncbi:transcription factor GAGA-like isoform X2 [Eriocheir sinensis]|uniref:transcription factor GAGA-like isoform X2 n=1 Tax=Eriocheir sinensis TaxID=95602 RepID=UPI0021C66B57|nr:transcription factor GAGA-like isoform X2 [Eriocheir sinensis]
MTEEILSLKWNNHHTTFFHVLSSVRLKEAYSDATVACEGKFFPVHKLVMSSCSDYFEQIFQVVQCRHPVIVLKDITYQHMDLLLSYMYLGEVKVARGDLQGLLRAAECLRIKGLAVPDESPVKEEMSPSVTESEGDPSPPRKRLRAEEVVSPQEITHIPTPQSQNPATATTTTDFSSQYQDQENREFFDLQVQPFGDPVNVVKDEVKYEMQENANMAKGTGVPVSQNMVPAAGVGTHGTHQPHTGQEPLFAWSHPEGNHQNNMNYPMNVLPNTLPELNLNNDPGNNRISSLKCAYCEKMFIYPAKLASHLRTHTGEKPFACPYCPYRATQQGNLNRHVKIKHYVEQGN